MEEQITAASAQSRQEMGMYRHTKMLLAILDWAKYLSRKTKTNSLPITQLGHFQIVVKPEPMLLSDYLLHSIENHS